MCGGGTNSSFNSVTFECVCSFGCVSSACEIACPCSLIELFSAVSSVGRCGSL